MPGLLVLDDIHRLVSGRCLDIVSGLIDHAPPGLSVALVGRSEPQLPLARYRAQGSLLEIGTAELALHRSEAMAMAKAAGCHLAPAEVPLLMERTEGWPVAVLLATLAAIDDGAAPRRPGDIAGTDPLVADYLRSEFAHDLSDADMSVLARSAILESVPGELADTLAGPGAGERLWTLARDHRLISRIGRADHAVRFHPLLRDFLLMELERREPGVAPSLHRSASAWYASVDQHSRAVEQSIASGDVRLSAAAITAGAPDATGQTVDRWLSTVDAAACMQYPPVAVVGAWRHLLAGRSEVAEELADIAEGTTFDGQPSDGSRSYASQLARLRALMGRRGPDAMLADALEAVRAETTSIRWHTTAVWLLGEAYLLIGKALAADSVLRDAASAPSPDRLPATLALAARASLRLDEGDWSAADALIGESLAYAAGLADRAPAALLRLRAVDARVAAFRGDAARARNDLAAAESLVPLANHTSPWMSVDSLLHLVQAYLAMSDIHRGQDTLERAAQIVRRRPSLGTLGSKLRTLRSRVAEAAATLIGSSVLTPAELRIVPYLPTHLSFQEIADRLTISRNTVKTHAMSIYGKLWASSRDEAVRRAIELGLLPPSPVLDTARSSAGGLRTLDDRVVARARSAPRNAWVIRRSMEPAHHGTGVRGRQLTQSVRSPRAQVG